VIGHTPSEVFHGMEARLPLDEALKPRPGFVKETDAEVEEYMCVIKEAQERACKWVCEAHAEYARAMDDDVRNRHKKLRRLELGELVLRRVKDKDVGRKVKPRFEVRPFVVVKCGHRGNYAIQRLRETDAKVAWAHVDELKQFVAAPRDMRYAVEQAKVAAQPEYVMEAIIGHRGNWAKAADREFLVKWWGFEDEHNTWEKAANLNNDKAVKQYVKEVNNAKFTKGVADFKKAAGSKKCGAVVKAEDLRSEFIKADLLEWNPATIVQDICGKVGIAPEKVKFVWASPPCRTMSNAAYNVGRGEGHGYNFRDFSDPERGPCCSRKECKYRMLAVEHDRFLPMLQLMFQADRRRGLQYDFAVENPRACMRLRPYAQLHQWPDMVQVALKTVDLCAFSHPAMKPTDLFTSLTEYAPKGETGSGRCERKCRAGHFTEKGSYLHELAFAQEPARNPAGHMRIAMPAMLLDELLQESMGEDASDGTQWVIDLFCGFRSMEKPAHARGCNYVGVDIKECGSKPAKNTTPKAKRVVDKPRGAECRCTVKCPPRYSDTTAAASHGWACSKLYEKHRYDAQGRDRYAAR